MFGDNKANSFSNERKISLKSSSDNIDSTDDGPSVPFYKYMSLIINISRAYSKSVGGTTENIVDDVAKLILFENSLKAV